MWKSLTKKAKPQTLIGTCTQHRCRRLPVVKVSRRPLEGKLPVDTPIDRKAILLLWSLTGEEKWEESESSAKVIAFGFIKKKKLSNLNSDVTLISSSYQVSGSRNSFFIASKVSLRCGGGNADAKWLRVLFMFSPVYGYRAASLSKRNRIISRSFARIFSGLDGEEKFCSLILACQEKNY